MEARLVGASLATRCVVLMTGSVLDAALPDYDSSKYLSAVHAAPSVQPRSTDVPLGWRWIVWDSVFYADIAARGYQYEQYYAFFPLFPALAALLGQQWFAATALLLNVMATAVSTVLLFRLGVHTLRSRRLAATACLFFILNPASIFHAAAYTEATFTLATTAALYMLYCRGWVWRAAAAAALSSAIRSNGVVAGGYLGHYCTAAALAAWPQSKARSVALACQGVAAAALAVAPVLLFQYTAYRTFCINSYGGDSDQVQAAETGGLAFGTISTTQGGGQLSWPRLWCSARPPSIYGFVQSSYWGVGFLRYYTISQLPNFALAAPVLTLSVAGIWEHCRANRRRAASLALLSPPQSAARGGGGGGAVVGYLAPGVTVFMYPWAFLVAVGALTMHVQVCTRLLSCLPQLYWYMAHVWSRSGRAGRWLWAWCFAYNALGAALFINFLPWT